MGIATDALIKNLFSIQLSGISLSRCLLEI